MLNLHIALNQESLLSEKAQMIVDASRLNTSQALSDLRSLAVNGIHIDQVAQELRDDYIIYQIQFSHRGLFTNQFLHKDDLEKPRFISLVSDRI
jgi:hypothetical protein